MALLRNLTHLRRVSALTDQLPTWLPAATATTSPALTRSFYSYSNEPTHVIPGKEPKWMSAEEAVSVVKSGPYPLRFL